MSRPAAPLVERWRAGREQAAYDQALPGVLEAVAAHLRSGSSLRAAVVEAGRDVPAAVAPALDALVEPAAAGVALVEVVDRWARRRTDPGTRLAAAALGLAASTGGAPARSLDAVAATLRDRLAIAGEVRALSAQARLSATVVGGAPLVFAVLAAGLDARTLGFLAATPVGLACLLGGVGLDVVGLWWMRRMVERVAW